MNAKGPRSCSDITASSNTAHYRRAGLLPLCPQPDPSLPRAPAEAATAEDRCALPLAESSPLP